jgi:epoxyqueuosine reductase
VKAYARTLGFDVVGITHLEPVPHGDALTRWLEHGMAATMTYMHRQAGRRRNPATIIPGATRAVMLARNYFHPDSPPEPGSGHVAKYARGRDYHHALHTPLTQLASYIQTLGDEQTIAQAFVDAGPVPERELAQRAGIGWIGKNTMLIHPRRGSFFFLAAILTNLKLTVDSAFDTDHCGTCRRCLDACPTNAFVDEYVLDSARCISYLTIEHRDAIDASLHSGMGTWIFGCDVCQDVCPWNVKFALEDGETMLGYTASLEWLAIDALLTLSEDDFRRRFGWTALERTGVRGLRRNARIASQARSVTAPDPPSATLGA